MRVTVPPTETGDLPSSYRARERPPCTLSSPCRKCEIQMILRGQTPGQMSREQASAYQDEHGCFQCKNQEHKCKPLSKAKAEASRQLVKAAVEHLFYGKPIKEWDDAMEKAKVVVKAEASPPSLNMSVERPLVPTPRQTAPSVAHEVPLDKTIKAARIVPAEETKLDSVPRDTATTTDAVENKTVNKVNTVVKQQKAMINALVKQQTIMVGAMVAMNKELVSVVEILQLGLEDK